MGRQNAGSKRKKTLNGSSTELVAGASLVRQWKHPLNLTKIHTTQVIEFIQKKGEFTRLDLEKEFKIDTGRSYWHIKNLLNKKLIVKTDKKRSLHERGKVYIVYKVR